MPRVSSLLTAILCVVGCSPSTPAGPPNYYSPAPQRLKLVGSVVLSPPTLTRADSVLALRVEITSLDNIPTALLINHDCPISLQLFRSSRGATVTSVYDDREAPCTLVARQINLLPNLPVTLTHEFLLSRLRSAGVVPGDYTVVLWPTASRGQVADDLLRTEAGAIRLP